MERILIGVCTRQRPQMLKQCLESLIHQAHPLDIHPIIVVVENDVYPHNKIAIEHFGGTIPIIYVHEPHIGIASARNAVLNKALEIGVDWIAFIDDDETAAPEWLLELMAREYRATPILMGRHEMVYEGKYPFWSDIKSKTINPVHEGRSCKTSACCNVRFSTALVRNGLRFNERIGFMGGEDIEFFSRAYAKGFTIRETTRAITHEKAHPKRHTLIAQFYRSLWCAASDIVAIRSVRGKVYVLIRKTHTIPANLIFGLAEIAISPFFLIGGLTSFKRRVLAGMKKIAKACGRVAALIGWLPQPYRDVVGH